MGIRHMDHVGIVVNDMEAAKEFFLDLGLTMVGETTVRGEWVGRVIGLGDVHSDIAMLQTPDEKINIELSKFHQPDAIANTQPETNVLGLRHIAFEVEDLDGILVTLKAKGTELVGEVEIYENSWKVCYIRGPENIIVELAEKLN